MEIVSKWGAVARVAMVFSAFLLTICVANPQARPDAAPSAMEESLKQFLQAFDGAGGDLDRDKATRYIAAFRDLNGNGTPEAIVYLIGNKWCGSGGCDTLILTRDAGSWRLVTEISITQLPIRVLTNTSHGWRSIGVWVQGGGIQPGYEAELRFDGKSYPTNPSVPPAQRLEGKPAGEVVVASERDAMPLYPDAAPSAPEESLKRFLQAFDGAGGDLYRDKATLYIAAFWDLNGDGTPEAIVHLIGTKWCRSGSCNTLILTRDSGPWRIVADISITRPPIYVLMDVSHGWRSIGVRVRGGGIQPGYEAELRFDGKSYPTNPSVPPARRLEGKPTGEVVIPSRRDVTPLYP